MVLSSPPRKKRTMAANYDVDVQIKKKGALDYTSFTLTIANIAGTRFLMFLHDASEIQAIRQKSAEYAELGRFSTYSRRILESVASLIEFRSLETGTHIERVENITKILLESVAELCPEYEITKRDIDLYTEGAILHDIGKIIVPDDVLNKTGKLTDEEMNLLRRHTVFGAKIIDRLTVKGQEELQAIYKDVALHHHERYDGKGYPDGLVGDANKIGVQVVSLADVYDALVSPRVYKAGIEHNKAVQMIMNGETGAFNPKLLQCFRLNVAKIQSLYDADVRKNQA
ncbi:MAG: HD domain-containing protein [Firmicutes bacterium]|nr:HD domain-containing protein [Bacillota bacterium]